MPLVSIVVPNYNYARYLTERMDSIFSQTFEDYEVIILDDCSTDNSREIIEQYRNHPKVKLIEYNEHNSGSPFKQWQKGVALASGKYVWIAETDDSAKPEFLSSAVELLEKNTDAVLAFTGADVVDSQGRITDTDFDRWEKRHISNKDGYRVLDGDSYIVHNMYWHTYVYNASGTVFRRDAVEEGMFERCGKMKNAGDWLFWTMLIGGRKNIEIYKKLNIYRLHDSNTTVRGIQSGNIKFEDIKVMKYIEDNYPVGWYRKAMRHGLFVKQIKREKWYSQQTKDEIIATMKRDLGASDWDYRLQRANKVLWHLCPLLLTDKNDRL